MQQSVNKLFVKATQEIPQDRILFKTEFFKMSNHKPIQLILTADNWIFKINKNKTYELKLNQEVRFSIKCEQASKQFVKQMKGDEFHTQIYRLALERDDTDPVEFYNFNFQTMYWFDNLRAELHMLDYQVYYDVSKLIGKGTFASVYEAKSKNDNQVYAAKAFYKKVAFQDPKGREQILNEIRIMRKLNHPNLINLHEVFENKAQIYLILDLAKGGTLEYSLKVLNAPVPFLSAKVIFRQIVEGVSYMHENNIMHRDLKPANILFREFVPLKRYGLVHVGPNVLISDFGVATEIQQKLNVYQYTGTPGYMAPEVFETETDQEKTYDEKADIFSLGCILYYLLIGKPLFTAATPDKVKQANIEMKINWAQVEQDLNQSHTLTLLLQRMLSPNAQERPSCLELLECKILSIEYGDDGVPVFRDFQRPKSSPPKKLQAEQPQKLGKRNSIMNSKAIKVMPIMEEKREIRDSNKEKHQKRNTHFEIDQARRGSHRESDEAGSQPHIETQHHKQSSSFVPNSVKQARRSSAIIQSTKKF